MHATPPDRPASFVLCGDDAGVREVVASLVRVIGLAYRQGREPCVYRFESR